MTWQQTLQDVGGKVMSQSHRMILKLSGGRVLHSPFGMPAVELHTIGAKTGKERVTMLTAPIHDEHRVILVASKGGDDRDPQWYGNVRAHPDIEVVIGGNTRKLRARTASAEEKAALWPQIVAAYKGYGEYQAKTDRPIPVVICEARPT